MWYSDVWLLWESVYDKELSVAGQTRNVKYINICEKCYNSSIINK